MKNLIIGFLSATLLSCYSHSTESRSIETYSDIHIVGAMQNVMWKGELSGIINLDTISKKQGLYGLGPESYLRGELLINNGQSYVSRVSSDSSMTVDKKSNVTAPFFVYAHVNEWQEITLADSIKTIQDIEKIVEQRSVSSKRPFAFKLVGKVSKAVIHIQNLAPGTTVSSPKEAHQGQVNYPIKNEEATIIGFFSSEHKGIFTHHDTNVHLHLISKDERNMGHLDELVIEKMTLFMPRK